MKVRRSLALALVLSLVASFAIDAQPTAKVARVGVLLFGTPEPFRERFRQALLQYEYIERRNLIVEYR